MDSCTVEGCDRPIYVKSRGMCRPHWRKSDTTAKLTRTGNAAGSGCSADGCERQAFGHGLCSMHYKREYAVANRSKLNQQAREWRKAHPGWADGWRAANAPSMRAAVAKRRAKIKASDVRSVTAKDLERLYNSPCIYCGSQGSIQADHIIPVSRGGRHAIGNLAPACGDCNRAKSGSTITEWRTRP